MIIDLRKGFGDFEDYKLFKFPDNSIKFELKYDLEDNYKEVIIRTTLRSMEDLFTLAMVKDVINRYSEGTIALSIFYMIQQQDDRLFADNESFGLRVVTDFINSLDFDVIEVFHPHSEVTNALLRNSIDYTNTSFIKWVLDQFKEPPVWVIPDSGAFKTQFKQIEKLGHKEFITCMKSRDHETGEITTVVNSEALYGKTCIIFDDLALAGGTFLGIAKELHAKGCRNMHLAVSHGVFNNGVAHLISTFNTIYTTDSICTQPESDRLKIFKLWK